MRLIFTLLILLSGSITQCQLLTWAPEFIQETSTPVEITMDATKGNRALLDYLPTDVYVHIGVITSSSTNASDWKYSKFSWGTTPASGRAISNATNKFTYTITGGLRNYFGMLNPAEKILKIAILFRNGNGSVVQRNADGSDMYVPVYEAGLNVRINNPPSEPKYNRVAEEINKSVGDPLPVTAVSSLPADLKLFLNNVQVGSTAINATTISETATINSIGQQLLVVEGKSGAVTKYDTIKFFVSPTVITAPLPAGLKDGVNYDANNTSVTLVLYAPRKTRVAVIGDFNNWNEDVNYQMKRTPDGSRYWLTINGLTAGTEYAYQYLIDGNLKVADYTTEKILDPNNDQYIPSTNYPNLKPYPFGKTTGIVSVLQTAKPTYNWQVTNFTKPDKRNLMIYELLVRDFVATQNWSTLKDTLSYLKKLGINAIEVMPFNEFEGNNSWGYNSDFYFAPDKMYGTETALKQFIDECHKQGIAVIMDIVMNHTYGPSPMLLMYYDGANNRPAADNPWYNPVKPHAFGFGDDFNHDSSATKNLFNNVLKHWITNYKIDGYRIDFSKGLTQRFSSNDAGFSAYDASRIAIIKGYKNAINEADPNAYVILEHFADNSEEKELSDNGMLIWANVWNQYQEASMGYLSNSNFNNGIFTTRNYTNPHLVTFMESHDEERITYKNIKYGNSAVGYNIKDTATALKRMEMNAAFLFTIPGPKMIYQFGELGYDYSRCYLSTNGEGGDCNTKTDPKPVKWDYTTNANRKAVYDVYSKLLNLRNVPNFLPTWVSSNVTSNLSGGFKSLVVTSDSLKLVVVGNFDVNSVSGSVTFPDNNTTWYNYLSGGTREVNSSVQNFTLQPGEYHVFLNRNVTPLVNALPLKLVSFSGKRLASMVALEWRTANEVNVNHFELQRSFDGIRFSKINKTAALNSARVQPILYTYNDVDPLALTANGNIYYRLKMVDNDGAYSFSPIVMINPMALRSNVSLYPNPVKGSQLFVHFDKATTTPVHITIEDIMGRVYAKYKVHPGNISNGLLPVNVNKLMNGTYVIKVETLMSTSVKQFVIHK